MGCDKRVYTLRGWLAFVSFLDGALALRSWLNPDTFLGSAMCAPMPSNCTDDQKIAVPGSTARLLLFFSLENALILLVCAFCIHHWSMIVMTVLSLLLKISYYFMESLKFRTARFNFHIIFPVVVHTLTLVALLYAPRLLRTEGSHELENAELVKMCNGKPHCLPPVKKKKKI